jgi:surface carbohydrate biosynthesis protein
MKFEYDYIFLIEHEDREKLCVERICQKLKLKGKSSCIISLEFHLFLMSKIDAKNIVIPYGFAQDQWPINYLYKMNPNAEFFSLNWEQILTPINQEYKKPRDYFFKEIVKHIAWTDDFKSFLIKSGVNEKNISITGNVHYELLAEECLNEFSVKKQISQSYNIDVDKKWVFLPMNYAWAFISDNEIRGKIKKGYDSINAWRYKEYAKKCLSSFIVFLDLLSQKYDDHIFIVRPHPSISAEQYYEQARKKSIEFSKNVYFLKDLTIREWIVASDVVGSSWSTSVWDAVNSGKKGFLFTPYKRPDFHDLSWKKSVINFSEFSEVNFDLLTSNILSERSDSLDNASNNIANFFTNSSHENSLKEKQIITKFNLKQLIIFRLKVLRTYIRYVLVRFFNGVFINKGLLRDYFEAKL